MFGRGIRLPFTLLGIPLILDWSFLLVLPLLAWLIGANVEQIAAVFGVAAPEVLAEPVTRYALGLLAAVGLFIGVVLHELGHAVVARLYGAPVESITLWFLGGVAKMPDMPRQPGAEAVVGIAGPIVSFIIAAVLWGVWLIVPPATGQGEPNVWLAGTNFVVAYLAALNAILGVFNLLPALPLDGGRVLRSLLALRMPHVQATRVAATISRIIAVGLGLLGILTINIFLIFIAFFIFIAVSSEAQMGQVQAALRDLRVRDLMNPDVHTVRPEMRCAEALQYMLDVRHLGFPVVDEDGRPLGVVTVEDVHNCDPDVAVSEVMRHDVPVLRESDDAIEAVRLMNANDLNRIAVVGDDGRLNGIVTKRDIMRTILLRETNPRLAMREAPAPQLGRGRLALSPTAGRS